MTRVLLINPPSPERLGTPLLGLQYVAAALIGRGCKVRVIDAAAREVRPDPGSILAAAETFRPDIVGFALFTRWVWHAYELVERFRGRFPLLIAGGAHATVRPEEAIRRGFDLAVLGEAETTIGEIVELAEGRRTPGSIRGIVYRGRDGAPCATPPATLQADLDDLPSPHLAQELFDPRWYDPESEQVIPGGVLTSRGCPARCTFCANYVTGRVYRYRSPANVIAELNTAHERFGATFFPCWDDALTANMRRVFALCETLERDIRFPLRWSAILRATHVSPELLRAMKRAGCVHVNFGVESGDDEVLRAVKKGITTAQVVRALEAAKVVGLTTACNFMMGFPEETPRALERTVRFMERIAPLVDTFSTLGVLIPFPGTPLYEENHQRHGFTDWWLREECSRYDAPPPVDDFDRFYRHYIDDTTLALDFFRYTDEQRALMRAALRFKGEHNLRKMGLLRHPLYAAEPA